MGERSIGEPVREREQTGLAGLFPLRYELLPAVVIVEVLAEQVIAVRLRLERKTTKVHVRLGQRFSAFTMVAGATGAHQVLPGVLSTTMSRNDVVERQIAGLHSAVLAGVVITNKDLAASEPNARARTLDEINQTDDRRPTERLVGCANVANAVLENLGLATVNEQDRPTSITHVQRLVILIQDQDAGHPSFPEHRVTRADSINSSRPEGSLWTELSI